MQDPSGQEKSDAPKKTDESSNTEQNPATSGPQGATIRITSAGSPEVLIRLEGISTTLKEAVSAISRPASVWTSLFRNIAPGLTSLAAVLISLAALIYTSHQKNVAERTAQEQRDKANEAARKNLLANIITQFGNKLPFVEQGGNKPPTDKETKEIQEFERTNELSAMKIAVYGEQALPGLRMALGSEDRGLKQGGVLVAEEMYRAKTMDRQELTKNILDYYKERSPTLRAGVLDWLREMDEELSPDENQQAYEAIKTSFGENGELCSFQDQSVAAKAANFLNRWSPPDSKSLLLGIVLHCRDDAHPDKFLGAREASVQALKKVAVSLSREQCDALSKQDLPQLRTQATDLGDVIEETAKSVQKICASK